MVAVGVRVDERVDARRRGHRRSHRAQHLGGQPQVEQRVDEQRGLAVHDQARVAPPPAAVGLKVGVEALANLLQPGGVTRHRLFAARGEAIGAP